MRKKSDKILWRPQGSGRAVLCGQEGRGLCAVGAQRSRQKHHHIDLILGLKTPDRGTAKILGMDAAKHRKQVLERVGVQLQNTQYQPSITVEEVCSSV